MDFRMCCTIPVLDFYEHTIRCPLCERFVRGTSMKSAIIGWNRDVEVAHERKKAKQEGKKFKPDQGKAPRKDKSKVVKLRGR